METVRSWRYWRGDVEGAAAPGFDDAAWSLVEVPHDAHLDCVPGTPSPFSATLSDGEGPHGWSVGGVLWYRTELPAVPPGQRSELRVDGAFHRSEVFVDGTLSLTHPLGYTPFTVDLGEGTGSPQVVAIRLDTRGSHSRWYSGGGLFRAVHLRVTDLAYLVGDGLFAWTERLDATKAVVGVQVEVCETGPSARTGHLRVDVIDPDGREVAQIELPVSTVPGGVTVARGQLTVPDPRPWVPCGLAEDRDAVPARYCVRATLRVERATDHLTAPLGLRTVEIDAREGLRISGVPLKLKGGCVHHDLGVLGAAAWAGAEEHRVATLKAAGFEALRTAHNPPSRAFLEACDRLGVLVVDEVHDEWETAKMPDSTHREFPEHGEADVRAMVRRDRNHPCVVLWSVGNEIKDAFTRPDIAARLVRVAYEEDPTRRVTAAICTPWWKQEDTPFWERIEEPAFRHLDVGGYNYLPEKYRSDHLRYPQRVMVGLESYALQVDEAWGEVERLPYVIGDFVWTAQDYFGESGIGQAHREADGPVHGEFPYHLAVCGDLDLIGDRKPQSWYRESLWRPHVLAAAVRRDGPVEREAIRSGWMHKWGWHDVAGHWTWDVPPGTRLMVEAYTNATSMTVWLNGTCVGGMGRGADAPPVIAVPVHYFPGTLEVRAEWPDGTERRTLLVTAAEPARLVLDATLTGRETVEPVHVVGLTVVDVAGQRHPWASLPVTLRLEGPGVLVGFGSANPVDVDDLRDAEHRTWQGRALAVVRRTGPGAVRVVASTPGLADAEVVLDARN